VYTAEGKLGRGGWTWYTGSASWFYRIGIETILGFTKRGDVLTIQPRVPRGWPGYTIAYRFGASEYTITVEQVDASDGAGVTLDGRRIESGELRLVDDGTTHQVHVRVRRSA
jgi:cyclic beta-1,2-glucan synthetase